MLSENVLVWAALIVGAVLLKASDTVNNDTSPIASHDRCCPQSLTKAPAAFLKAYTTCQRKPFGPNGLKLQVCETSLRGKAPSVVFRKLGRLDRKAEDAISSLYHGVFRKQSFSVARGNNRIVHDSDMCCPT